MFMLTIRNETQADRQIVEDITRRAFYNLYVPGCGEHYLVHIMRDHPDFIPELDFVAELGCDRHLRQSCQLRGPGLQELQKVQRVPGEENSRRP